MVSNGAMTLGNCVEWSVPVLTVQWYQRCSGITRLCSGITSDPAGVQCDIEKAYSVTPTPNPGSCCDQSRATQRRLTEWTCIKQAAACRCSWRSLSRPAERNSGSLILLLLLLMHLGIFPSLGSHSFELKQSELDCYVRKL